MKILVASTEYDTKSSIVEDSDIREYYIPKETDLDNKYWCELSVIDHLRKLDISDDEIVGLEHYRRFFINQDYNPVIDKNKFHILDKSDIENILAENDIILPIQYISYPNVLSLLFAWQHNAKLAKDFHPNIKECIYKWFTFLHDNYSKDFEDSIIMSYLNMRSFYGNNMFICKKKILNEYWDFIYPLLLEYKKYLNCKIPERLFGFLTEYTFGIYIMMKRYKIFTTYKICYNKNMIGVENYQFTKPELVEMYKKRMKR